MKGSATLWMGIAVTTRTSVSVLAVNAPRSIRGFITVPSIPMLSAFGPPDPSAFSHSAAEEVSATDDDGYFQAEIVDAQYLVGQVGQA